MCILFVEVRIGSVGWFEFVVNVLIIVGGTFDLLTAYENRYNDYEVPMEKRTSFATQVKKLARKIVNSFGFRTILYVLGCVIFMMALPMRILRSPIMAFVVFGRNTITSVCS